MTKLLLIDDDRELCQLLNEYLDAEGFTVDMAHDGEQALARLDSQSFDAIILDVMLPILNGFDVLKRLRQSCQTPVLMLTAKGDTIDRVVGLEIGADDYLAKPCDPRELVARVRAVLRRSSPAKTSGSANPERLSARDIVLHPASRSALWRDKELPLTGTEFSVLELLVRAAGQVVSKDHLTEEALNRKLTPYDRSIDVHVSNIRKKLTQAGADKELIINVRGAGYMLTLSDEQAP
ncbi:response regulator transcription factor [Marinimicrobium alkaliphilum]|uniref:response regulator transcription factor n=1 Tax=Marinimicrobium alkaliphilum TaxID=2202654 RepID=UPI000DBA31A4|nr:response regulator transcription factor [Marinimicrobium alkaliphilum]